MSREVPHDVSVSATGTAARNLMSTGFSEYPSGSRGASSPLVVSSSSMGGVSVSMPTVGHLGEGSSLLEDSSFMDNFGYYEDMDMLPLDGPSGEDWSSYFWSSGDAP